MSPRDLLNLITVSFESRAKLKFLLEFKKFNQVMGLIKMKIASLMIGIYLYEKIAGLTAK